MEDQNRGGHQDRNFHNRNRHNRFHRHGGGGGGGHGGGGRGGRSQRPLLTSSINAAGLSFVALVLMLQGMREQTDQICLIGWSVVCFGISALVSYVSQRVQASFVEKISDYLFIIGVVLMIWVAIHLSGIYTMM